MDLILKYFAGPLIAAALTTFFVWFKDSKNEKSKQKRIINEERLTKVYNKLHVISIKYKDFLDIEWIREAIRDNEGNRFHIDMEAPVIRNIEKWNEAIEESKKVVHENLHLLDRDEIALWSEVIHWDNGEEVMEEEQVMKYSSFTRFIESITENYAHIYDNYYMESKEMKKKIIKDYQNKIKELESNQKLKSEKKNQEIARINKEIEKIKKRK